jgi:hypothetical protein
MNTVRGGAWPCEQGDASLRLSIATILKMFDHKQYGYKIGIGIKREKINSTIVLPFLCNFLLPRTASESPQLATYNFVP